MSGETGKSHENPQDKLFLAKIFTPFCTSLSELHFISTCSGTCKTFSCVITNILEVVGTHNLHPLDYMRP
jgi:hypothetical protein